MPPTTGKRDMACPHAQIWSSREQGRVTEGDRDKSPRVTRASHRGGQKSGIGEDKKAVQRQCAEGCPKEGVLPQDRTSFISTSWGSEGRCSNNWKGKQMPIL